MENSNIVVIACELWKDVNIIVTARLLSISKYYVHGTLVKDGKKIVFSIRRRDKKKSKYYFDIVLAYAPIYVIVAMTTYSVLRYLLDNN